MIVEVRGAGRGRPETRRGSPRTGIAGTPVSNPTVAQGACLVWMPNTASTTAVARPKSLLAAVSETVAICSKPAPCLLEATNDARNRLTEHGVSGIAI